jgi:hypothetical protein
VDTNNHRLQKFAVAPPMRPVAVQNSTWGRLKTLYVADLTRAGLRGK